MATRRRRAAGTGKAITRGGAKAARGAARFRRLTRLSSDWYWEQDAECRLTFMSSYIDERTGLDASSYLGRKRWEQPALNLTEADWERHRAQLERREPFRDFEIQRAAGDGHSVWLSLSGEPVFDGRGRFKGSAASAATSRRKSAPSRSLPWNTGSPLRW